MDLLPMIREGQGTPLVLLHGVMCSERVWRRVVPLLAPKHDVIVPTALGHRGGNVPTSRPVRIGQVVDDAQRLLDDLRLEGVHFAGNSLGGWVALELARRGRARSVCALSPAGFWGEAHVRNPRAVAALRGVARDTRIGLPVLPWLARSARFRRWAMRLNAVRGEQVAPADLVESARDVTGCTIAEDLFVAPDALARFDRLPCPITIAWAERDRVLPLNAHREHVEAIVPGARFVVLEGVGHVPMFDAPELVARTVLESTGSAPASSGAAA